MTGFTPSACLQAVAAALVAQPLGKIQAVFPQMDAHVDALGHIQGHIYQNRCIAVTALLHRSSFIYWPTDRTGMQSNERLEFLGDSFVNLFVTTRAMAHFPELPEGRLSRFRSTAVGAASLATKAQERGIGELLFLGKGEANTAGASRLNLLADAFEAVTAALYLDAGAPVAEAWLETVFASDFNQELDAVGDADPKSALQELTQKELSCVPEYRVVEELGQGTELRFVVAGYLGGRELARECAGSKKAASRAVAATILKKLESQDLRALLGEKV